MYAPQIKDQIIKNLLDEGYEGTALKEELIKRIVAQAVAKAKAENASPYGQNLDLEVVRITAENAVRWNNQSRETALGDLYIGSDFDKAALKYFEFNESSTVQQEAKSLLETEYLKVPERRRFYADKKLKKLNLFLAGVTFWVHKNRL